MWAAHSCHCECETQESLPAARQHERIRSFLWWEMVKAGKKYLLQTMITGIKDHPCSLSHKNQWFHLLCLLPTSVHMQSSFL